jgi:hypothetical protein
MLGKHIDKIEKRLARVRPISLDQDKIAAALRKQAFGYSEGEANFIARDLSILLEKDVPELIQAIREVNGSSRVSQLYSRP